MEGQKFSVLLPGRTIDELFVPLLGRHQLENAACAVGAIDALERHGIQISDEAIRKGLERVKWPGRMETVHEHPRVMLDCAKDDNAMMRVKETLGELEHKRIIAVISISSDKNITAMIDAIAPAVDYAVISRHKVMDRGAEPEKIAEEFRKHGIEFEIIADVKDGVKRAMELAENDDIVIVTGSLFTVSEARNVWNKTERTWGADLNETPKDERGK